MSAGVCHPQGFEAAGVTCGLRRSGRPDLALVVSDRPATVAGVFTRNRIVAAPVLLSRRHVADGQARAIVTNSANANACTGPQGELDAAETAELAAGSLGLAVEDVLVCSTGIIGRPLDMTCLRRGVPAAAGMLSASGGASAAEAIMTTDAYPKLATADVALAAGEVRIGAMAKGAGMIRPDMATTLAQVTTDAAIPADLLVGLLREACDASFNVISVDGSTSTNDCILVLANGAAGVAVQDAADAQAFGAALTEVLLDLAKQIVADGEGATRYARYEITGAHDDAQARAAARAVGENPLVRCALHGSDPNWGRMLTALGSCGVDLDPDAVDLWIGDVQVVAGGAGIPDTEQAAHAALDRSAVEVRIDLALGTGCAVLYASDLSPAYVRFNAEYST